MKRILFFIAGTLMINAANAQKNLLAFDESNKYIYYQVVDTQNAGKDSLDRKALSFLRETYKKDKFKVTGDSIVIVKDKIITYSTLAFVKHESGEVDFTFTIECKDNKYRYWFTGFIFKPYVKDRYGNFVPEPGIEYPLEKASAKLDKKELDAYLDQTGAYCKETGDNLKIYMSQNHQTVKAGTQPVKKIVTDKW